MINNLTGDGVDYGSEKPLSRHRSLPEGVVEGDHSYEILAQPRRRYGCYSLREDTQWSLTDVATKVAAWENDLPEHAVTDRQRGGMAVSLYHAHAPKFVEDGIIAFDDVAETITVDKNAKQVVAPVEGVGASFDGDQEIHAQGDIHDGKR